MPPRRFTPGRVAWNLLTVAMTGTALAWTLGLGYAPLRYGTAGVILVAAAASLLLGPVADNWPARLLRTLGCAAFLAEGLLLAHSFARATGADQLREKTEHGVPVFGLVLVCCTLALAAATSRRTAAGARALAVGGGAAAVTAVVVLVPVLLRPPLPATPGWALLAVFTAAFAVFLVALKWVTEPRQAVIAVLCAVVVTSVLFAAVAEGLLQLSVRWVPDTSPANVPAADRLLNNRLGAEDPYLRILALGLLAALPLAGLTVRLRRVPRISPISDIPGPGGVTVKA